MFPANAVAALVQACAIFSGLTEGIQLPPVPKDKTTPVQQRISFKGPREVSVAWNTYEKLDKPCVQYGTHEDHLTETQCSTVSVTYTTSRTWSNHVVLKGLKPATKYYYRIGSTNPSRDFFQTAREAGDKTPFVMLTLADLGLYGEDGYTSAKRSDIPHVQPALNHTTIGRMAATANEYDFVIHPGDLAYADDWIEDPKNFVDPGGSDAFQAIIETFYTQLAPISARKPYMVSPGNHEADCQEVSPQLCPDGQTNFSDFRNRFAKMMPTVFELKSSHSESVAARKRARSLANPPFWYSFDYGMAHVVMIDTETDFKNAPDAPGGSANLDSGPFGRVGQQLDFLNADLASVDRDVTPWVIVAGHRPWYTVGDSTTPCGPCQTAFEKIFYKYGVDVGVFGHVHNLQRFDPIYKGKVDKAGMNNPKAPMYTVIGGPGNIEGHSATTPKTTGNVFAYNSDYGFGHLNFHNRTHLGIDYYRSRTGKKLDSSVLIKQHKERFVRQEA